MQRWSILVHGGAATWPEDVQRAALDGLPNATEEARRILSRGGSALDAVEAAVSVLEDDPTYNAGTGGRINLQGDVELDASLMEGHTMRAGAVCGLQRTQNPIQVARRVLEHTPHVLLSGDGATRFARSMGFPDYDPTTPAKLRDYQHHLTLLENPDAPDFSALRTLLDAHPELRSGTVGAVALDTHGNLAAATSTGGTSLKIPGRVGDTPILGAGTYATPYAAASATGLGELAMRACVTFAVCAHIQRGLDAYRAILQALDDMDALHIATTIGVISLDRSGTIGAAHGTAMMPHAWHTHELDEPCVRLFAPAPNSLNNPLSIA